MPMPCFKDVSKKEVEDSTSTRGIWCSKPISLNVSPGSKVPLENIMLTDPPPSVAKDFQETFGDKYVCIFMPSSHHAEASFLDAMLLMDAYLHIKSSGGKFEVICVPPSARNELINKYIDPFARIEACASFSHVPVNDNACLERIAKTIGLPQETTYVIVGPMVQRVVSIFDSDFLRWHGAEAYPFTAEKIQQLSREDEALLSAKHDLGTLLSTRGRDFLISNDCREVPISDLKRRIVCLLFYEFNFECKRRTEELKQVYKEHRDFEVVVVFALAFGHDTSHLVGNCGKLRSELKFWEVFRDMPWLAVPFDDPKCRQLWRIFNRTKICNDSYAPKLIIIHPEGKYFEENGFQVLEKTRFEFMGQAAVTPVKRKTLLSSFLGRDAKLLRNEVIYDWKHSGKGQEKYTVSELFGAPVVLFFTRAPGFKEFLCELKSYHAVASGTLDKFEVVYVPIMESRAPPPSWMLVSLSSVESNKALFTEIFKDAQNPEEEFTLALVTFGPFGHYFKQGIIFTTSLEDAYQLFLEIFPFRNNKTKEVFESRRAKKPSYLEQSRVDKVRNWAMLKKRMNSFDRGGSKYAALGGSGGNDGFSRDDEVHNWAVGKKQNVVGAPPVRGSSSFGSGFCDFSGPGGWSDRRTRGGGGGLGNGEEQQRRCRLMLDAQSERGEGGVALQQGVMKAKVNLFGDSKPREVLLEEKRVGLEED